MTKYLQCVCGVAMVRSELCVNRKQVLDESSEKFSNTTFSPEVSEMFKMQVSIECVILTLISQSTNTCLYCKVNKRLDQINECKHLLSSALANFKRLWLIWWFIYIYSKDILTVPSVCEQLMNNAAAFTPTDPSGIHHWSHSNVSTDSFLSNVLQKAWLMLLGVQ